VRTLFVAGHSDSGDSHLPEGVQPWPERTRAWLQSATGETWTLVTARFAPLGPGAPDYLLTKVEAAAPDLVVVPLTAYVCTVGTVEESVRQRFGERAARWFRTSETGFQRRTAEGAVRRRVNFGTRRLARRMLGARPLATVAQTADIYEEVLHRLARVESLQVVVVADARFSSQVQAVEPLLQRRFDELNSRLLPVARAHRFFVADLEGALRQTPERSVFYARDGIHTTPAFHQVYFELLSSTLRDLAAAPKG
jgi:hypothetical protein